MLKLLSPEEEKDFLDFRIKRVKKKVQRFLFENKGDKKAFFPIFRLFLLAENYAAEDLIPYDKIKQNLNDLALLNQLVRDFRTQVRYYDNDIQKIVLKGQKLREGYRPSYPSFFQDKERVYLKINPVSSGFLFLKNLIDKINLSIPNDESVKVVEKGFSFLVQSAKDQKCHTHVIGTKAGRFLKKQSDFLSQILTRVSSSNTAEDFVSYLNGIHSYQDYLNTYSKFKSRSCFSMPRALMTPVLFYEVMSKGALVSSDDLKNRLFNLREFYSKQYQDFHLMQAVHKGNEQKNDIIDMLVLSKYPSDIAKMSAYAEYSKDEWASCLTPKGINSHYLPEEIGNGVFVAFGINSKNPAKKLARISIKPFVNENGNVYFKSGYMYGLKIPAVREQLDEFLSQYQPRLRGAFSLFDGCYKDAEASTYYFNMDEYDILKHQNLIYSKGVDGRICVGNWNRKYLSLTAKLNALDAFFDSRPKLSVSSDGVASSVSFKNMDIYGIFECYYFSKKHQNLLPFHADELRLLSSNIHDFKGIKNRYFSLQMHLSNHLKSLEGLSLDCSDVSLCRMQITAPVFKLPPQVRNFESGVTKFNIDHLDLSHVTGSVQISESYLENVKEITLPKKAERVDLIFSTFPEELFLDIRGITSFMFAPFNCVSIHDFKMDNRVKRVHLTNVLLKETDVLDFSNCDEVSLHNTSLKDVKKLILPKGKTVYLKGCDFPYPLKEEDIIRNGGYGLWQNKVRLDAQHHPMRYLSSNYLNQNG